MITYIPFDERRFDFVTVVKNIFSSNVDLRDLYCLADEQYNNLFEVGKDSSTEFHKNFMINTGLDGQH